MNYACSLIYYIRYCYASAGPEQPVWAHGGSTRRIASADALKRAIRYVLKGQGEPMEIYRAEPRPYGRG